MEKCNTFMTIKEKDTSTFLQELQLQAKVTAIHESMQK
jgi:hypothetical protein